MRGFWADERVDGKIWDLKNPVFKSIYNFFKKKEKQYFSQSDAIVSLTENGKQEILSWDLENVTEGILDPRNTYANASDWEVKARDLAGRYIKNFEQYCDNDEAKKLVAAGPQL